MGGISEAAIDRTVWKRCVVAQVDGQPVEDSADQNSRMVINQKCNLKGL